MSDYFKDTSDDLVIHVPNESLDTYKSANYWSSYANRIVAIE